MHECTLRMKTNSKIFRKIDKAARGNGLVKIKIAGEKCKMMVRSIGIESHGVGTITLGWAVRQTR